MPLIEIKGEKVHVTPRQRDAIVKAILFADPDTEIKLNDEVFKVKDIDVPDIPKKNY